MYIVFLHYQPFQMAHLSRELNLVKDRRRSSLTRLVNSRSQLDSYSSNNVFNNVRYIACSLNKVPNSPLVVLFFKMNSKCNVQGRKYSIQYWQFSDSRQPFQTCCESLTILVVSSFLLPIYVGPEVIKLLKLSSCKVGCVFPMVI